MRAGKIQSRLVVETWRDWRTLSQQKNDIFSELFQNDTRPTGAAKERTP
jgi:hypothetical protein